MTKTESLMVSFILLLGLLGLPGFLFGSIDGSRLAPLSERIIRGIFPRIHSIVETDVDGNVGDATLIGDSMDVVLTLRRGGQRLVEYKHHKRGTIWEYELPGLGSRVRVFDSGHRVAVTEDIDEGMAAPTILTDEGVLVGRKEGYYDTVPSLPSPSGKYFLGENVRWD